MNAGFYEILIILLLILINGVLAMSEIAVVSARKVRLQQRAEEGESGAAAALELASHPANFLSSIQVGITLVGILAGAFGGATIAGQIQSALAEYPLLAPYSQPISVGIVVVVITYFSLIIGELVPKQIALNNPEKIASRVAPLMKFIARVASPVVRFLSYSSALILRLLGARPSTDPQVTEEEVKIMIEMGTRGGVFEPIEEEMVEQVFRLSDQRVTSIMTPRTEVEWLDVDDPPTENQQIIITSGYSYFPVARQELDHLIGVVHAKDLLSQSLTGQRFDLPNIARQPLYVPESMPVFQVLEKFKEHSTDIAFVIDEFGGVIGLVTTTDVLEAIVGAIPQLSDLEDPDIVRRDDGSFLLDGMISTNEFKDLFEKKNLPDEEDGYFETLGGFVMTYLGRIPATGDVFIWEDLRIEVVDMDGNRVDKLLVARIS
jgi:putative hemolysin